MLKLVSLLINIKLDFKVINNIEGNIEFVTGEDIRKWYLEENYQFDKGQLSNSCMRYERCQKYLDIYVENPEVCQLMILKGSNPDKIIGRSLIWKLQDGRFYQDRQYTNIESDKSVFANYAKSKGWLYYGFCH
jgi:hypothetical protein